MTKTDASLKAVKQFVTDAYFINREGMECNKHLGSELDLEPRNVKLQRCSFSLAEESDQKINYF